MHRRVLHLATAALAAVDANHAAHQRIEWAAAESYWHVQGAGGRADIAQKGDGAGTERCVKRVQAPRGEVGVIERVRARLRHVLRNSARIPLRCRSRVSSSII